MVSVLGTGAAVLVPLAITEQVLAAAARDALECAYAADSLLVYAMTDLQRRPTWDGVLDGSAPSGLTDTTRAPRVHGAPIDLDVVGAALPGFEPGAWGPNAPRWVLFAWGRARAIDPRLPADVYVAAWAADDERDGDGDSRRDANARVLLHTEAFGPARGRRAARVLIARRLPAPAPLRVLDWRWP
jgi:hypothetical protein